MILKTRFWLLFGIVVLGSGFDFPLQKNTTSPEYQVKAVFLFNFTQFIEWPTVAFSNTDSPMIIGILGKDPFKDYIDETVRGEKINGHPLIVERFEKPEDIQTCHILFISETEKKQLKNILQSLGNKKILTVSDMMDFAKQGGMIRFVTENNKTRIRVNLEATKEADLIVSSKLLRLAEIVSTSK